MNTEIKKISRNVVYTFSSNVTSFLINALVVLVIPKVIGVSEYAYFQLYLLLATYALYFHFGWCDGIYLINVGKKYDELDKEMLSSQFIGIVLMSAIIFVLLSCGVLLFCDDTNKEWVYYASIAVIGIVTPKTFTSVVMQMTNRMKNYSQIVLAEKVVYAIILSVMLIMGIKDFKLLILSDCIGKLVSLILGCFFCKEILYTKIHLYHIKNYISEAKRNVVVGLFLLLSNVASLLITGIVQFCAEQKWSIETFGKVSMSFNISKMLMVVITAMSIVLVPLLKHMDDGKLSNMYIKIRTALMVVLGGLLTFYYPLKLTLSSWLPQYIESIRYIALLFPMCLFESKTQMLLNTYFKAMREERKLFRVNIITVVISAAVSYITIYALEKLDLAILSIPYILAFKCMLLEYNIGKKLNLKLLKDGFLDVLLATVFIASSWFIDNLWSAVIYAIFYVFYLMCMKENLAIIRLSWLKLFDKK